MSEQKTKPQQDPLQGFSKAVKITAHCRFNASERLKRQSQHSRWTTVIISTALIYVTALDAIGTFDHFKINFIGVIQIVASAFILTYSTMLSMNNYDAKAEKHHQCGTELNSICRRLQSEAEEDQAKLQVEYEQIISRYLNHSYIDFRFAQLERPEFYTLKWYQRVWVYLRYWLPFSHYYITIALSIAMIFSSTIIVLGKLR